MLQHHLLLGEEVLHALDLLILLVALADEGDDVAVLGVVDDPVDGVRPVGNGDILPVMRARPTLMSSLMASTSSSRGLSMVRTVRSAYLALISPMSYRRRRERLPPPPKRQMSRWGR